MVKPFGYLLASLVVALSVATGLYLSLDHQKKLAVVPQPESSIRTIAQTSFSGEVLNASYSAVPAIKESVVSQKGFVDRGKITLKGDDLLVLVNKSIGLPAAYVPADLVNLDVLVQAYPTSFLRKEAARALVAMFNDAKASGYSLTVTSAYRSWASQQATYNYWVATVGLANASQVSARAGHSQHQLGTAVDLSAVGVDNNLSPDFGKTAYGAWLAMNSWQYGYVLSYPAGKETVTGYAYEPWHFRYIGVTAATQMHNLGLDLETYLQKYGVW